VAALITGAARHLRPGGSLTIVAQNVVPVGRMLAAHVVDSKSEGGGGGGAGGFAEGSVQLWSSGRFSVWRARTVGVGEGGATAVDVDVDVGNAEAGGGGRKKKKRKKEK